MKISQVNRTKWLVAKDLIKELPDLLLKMIGNRVTFAIESSDLSVSNKAFASRFGKLMIDFCEQNNTGYWTKDVEIHDNVVDDSGCYINFSSFRVLFENASDADQFVNNFLVLHKFSN